MTAGVGDRAHEASLLEGGVNAEHLIAWTGTRSPSPGKWRGLASKDIESAFGTLGRPGERLDDIYWQDGDPSEYVSLVESGLTMIATDVPYRLFGRDGLPKDFLDRAAACLNQVPKGKTGLSPTRKRSIFYLWKDNIHNFGSFNPQ